MTKLQIMLALASSVSMTSATLPAPRADMSRMQNGAARHAARICDITDPNCLGTSGVHRGLTMAVTDCSLYNPFCTDGVHRG